MGNSIIDIDMSKFKETESLAQVLGIVIYATECMKDIGICNKDIIPTLEAMLNVDILIPDNIKRSAPIIFKTAVNLSEASNTDIKTTIEWMVEQAKMSK